MTSEPESRDKIIINIINKIINIIINNKSNIKQRDMQLHTFLIQRNKSMLGVTDGSRNLLLGETKIPNRKLRAMPESRARMRIGAKA